MSQQYGKPAIVPVGFDFESARLTDAQAYVTLSRSDVLGIVQSAFEAIGPASQSTIAVKHEVLDTVAEGRLADALRTAIIGAGKAGCTCCD